MQVCVGGTFDHFHKGHELLLQTAFKEAGKQGFVFIGITAQKLHKSAHKIELFQTRYDAVHKYVQDHCRGIPFRIEKIITAKGPLLDTSFDVVIVSPDTRGTAEAINKQRQEKGLKPFRIVQIPFVLADDGKPISSTRIRNGEVTPQGTPC